MASAKFELFEAICGELTTRNDFVLTSRLVGQSVLDDLKGDTGESLEDEALDAAVADLRNHFEDHHGKLPFEYDADTRVCRAVDKEFVCYIAASREIRGNKEMSRDFEVSTCKRLEGRLAGGLLHHTGWPRLKKKKTREYRKHLQALGFESGAAQGRVKDAGFDILWLPPFGFIPVRPVVSIQCKNSGVDWDDAKASAATARASIARHRASRSEGTFLSLVIFNDYIEATHMKNSVGLGFVPIGLSDAASLGRPVKTLIL